MPTEREMAEAYIQGVEAKADALMQESVQLRKHAAECRKQLNGEPETDEETKEAE